MNKKGIELSVNFLVIVIISLVILSSGILIVRQYFSTAEDIKTQLDEQTERQIEASLGQGKLISIPFKKKTIGRGDSDIIGLGILNIYDNQKEFNVNISLSNAYDNNKNQIETDEEIDIRYENSFELDSKEKKIIPIRIAVPKQIPSGNYIFNVEIDQYDKITKIYITVP